MSDLRDRIFSRPHLARTTVEAFGETIGVREFSVEESRDFLALVRRLQAAESPDAVEFDIWAVIRGACDPDTGERLFREDDADWLVKQSAKTIGAVAKAVLRVNGLSPEGADEAAGNS